MAYEIFTRKVQWGGSPSVTFTSNGRFAFNKTATAQFEKNAVENVLLMWDAERNMIGVRPITKKDSRAYKVHMGKKGNGCGFSASTFLKYIGLDISPTKSNIPARWNEKEEIFEIEVPKEYLKKSEPVLIRRTRIEKAKD